MVLTFSPYATLISILQSEKLWPIVPRTIVYKALFSCIFGYDLFQMNKTISVSTEYLSPSRTIEILEMQSFEESKQVYVYNYEGNHFRYFDSLIGLLQFFELGVEPKIAFETENNFHDFLTNQF